MDPTAPFIGRQQELEWLERLLQKKSASLVVIRGRRRIGKSRLVEYFAKGKKFFQFSGLPPTDNTTAQSQRNEFAFQLSQQTGLPEIVADDWSKLFLLLADKVKRGRVIILLDEISWMGHKDPDFLDKLKNIWDTHLSKNPQLLLVLCGSVSPWIEENILSSDNFSKRISLSIDLAELSLVESYTLLQRIGFKRSISETFTVLSVTGGVPWYLEQMDSMHSAFENIKHLCFEPNSILIGEYSAIFHNLSGRKGTLLSNIVRSLASGPRDYNEIVSALNYHRSGSLSDYLHILLISGFITRDYTWNIRSNNEAALSRYRLSDNYLRFYLKYIAPKYQAITRGQFSKVSLSTLPHWNTIMGLQFENLVLNNRELIHQQLKLSEEEILIANPYFQRRTQKQAACQIDYLIQTRFKQLYLCEIKFSKDPVSSSVITEVKEKIKRLSLAKGFACSPVLIHVNGVTEKVKESGFFNKIIGLGDLLIDH